MAHAFNVLPDPMFFVYACAESVFLIEGLGQQTYGALNWGDGLITDRDTISRTGLSDPNPFFQVRQPAC